MRRRHPNLSTLDDRVVRFQECPARVLEKSVQQKCYARVCQERVSARVFSKKSPLRDILCKTLGLEA